MMKPRYCFLMDEKEFPLEINSTTITQFPKQIADDLLINGNYKLSTNVPDEILTSFLNYLDDKTQIPQINSDNIIYYMTLNEELKIMSDLLSKQEYTDISKLSAVKNVALNENDDKSIYEKYISQNLDYFIENYSNEMYKIPINVLSNIFNHTERNLINHEKAYQFIKNGIENENEDFSILLNSLDGLKLSEKSFIESLSNKDSLEFYPKTDFSFVQTLNHNLSELNFKYEESYKNMMSIIQKQQQQIENLEHSISYMRLSSASQQSLNQAAQSSCESLKHLVNIGQITSIKLPIFLTSITNSFFAKCEKLESVECLSLLTSIGDNAFDGCTNLKEIKLPPYLVNIGNYCFQKCSKLEKIEIPSFVMTIGSWAFGYCSSLKKIVIPFSVTEIQSYAFRECSSLEEVEIAPSIKTIYTYTFYGCTSLKKIKIPLSVTSIGDYSFQNCSSLDFIEIPQSVQSIGTGAFYGCTSLVDIKIGINFNSSISNFLPPNIHITNHK